MAKIDKIEPAFIKDLIDFISFKTHSNLNKHESLVEECINHLNGRVWVRVTLDGDVLTIIKGKNNE